MTKDKRIRDALHHALRECNRLEMETETGMTVGALKAALSSVEHDIMLALAELPEPGVEEEKEGVTV